MRIGLRGQIIFTFISILGIVIWATATYIEDNIRKRWNIEFESRFSRLKDSVSEDISYNIDQLNRKMNSIVSNQEVRRTLIEYLVSVARNAPYRSDRLRELMDTLYPVSGLDTLLFFTPEGKRFHQSGRAIRFEGEVRPGVVARELETGEKREVYLFRIVPVTVGNRFAGYLAGGMALDRWRANLERIIGVNCRFLFAARETNIERETIVPVETTIPGFLIGVEKDRTELDQEMRAVRRNLIKAGVLGFLIAIPFIYYLGNLLSRRLKYLAGVATAIGEGERDIRVKVRGKDEIGVLLKTMDQMIRNLNSYEDALKNAERVAAWRDVARGIAHEIRNLFSPVQLEIGKLKRILQHRYDREKEDDLIRNSLKNLEQASGEIARMVGGFSEFARMPDPVFSENNLSEIIREVCTLAHSEPGTVSMKIDDDQFPLLCDREQIKRGLLNILKNAIESLDKQEKTVNIVLNRNSSGYIVEVIDNGTGMDRETLDNIFLPYFTRKKEGTGLGLVLADRIIRAHGGRITVDSRQGEGTRFVIELPRNLPAV